MRRLWYPFQAILHPAGILHGSEDYLLYSVRTAGNTTAGLVRIIELLLGRHSTLPLPWLLCSDNYSYPATPRTNRPEGNVLIQPSDSDAFRRAVFLEEQEGDTVPQL